MNLYWQNLRLIFFNLAHSVGNTFKILVKNNMLFDLKKTLIFVIQFLSACLKRVRIRLSSPLADKWRYLMLCKQDLLTNSFAHLTSIYVWCWVLLISESIYKFIRIYIRDELPGVSAKIGLLLQLGGGGVQNTIHCRAKLPELQPLLLSYEREVLI